MQTDRTLVWPDGSIYRVTRSSADTGGELLDMHWELPAGGWAPQPHVHPGLTEEYEVLAESFEVLAGAEWRTLKQGESASVPPGPFRVGAGPARVRNVHRPALRLRAVHQEAMRTANERNLRDLSGLRSLLYIAMLVSEYPQHSRAAGRLLNTAVRPLAAIGRLLRLKTA